MMDELTIQFTFAVDDSTLEDEERQEISRKLLRQLRNLDEIEKVERTEDVNPEVGSKPGFATLVGFLTAEVSVKNIKSFLGFLGERLGDKPIIINVKSGDKEIKIEAKSKQEILEIEKIVKSLFAIMDGEGNV
ncbi:hypothetical protein IQ257_27130 [Coleofasciculus sp. LEGE 07092]|nr:hypothetical protein [Coleofasciculus sp. LEGE 07081]MBE9152092.1 hypothetical protein [Coleofasciculus sp. LEGE 07092]